MQSGIYTYIRTYVHNFVHTCTIETRNLREHKIFGWTHTMEILFVRESLLQKFNLLIISQLHWNDASANSFDHKNFPSYGMYTYIHTFYIHTYIHTYVLYTW